MDSGGHDGGLHVSLRRLVRSCARHLRCASRVSSDAEHGTERGCSITAPTRAEVLAHPSRELMPSPGGPEPHAVLRASRPCTGRRQSACRCSPSSLPNPVAPRGLLTHDLFDSPVCWGLGRLGLDGASGPAFTRSPGFKTTALTPPSVNRLERHRASEPPKRGIFPVGHSRRPRSERGRDDALF